MTAITQPIDINPTYLETIQHILDEHVPNCEVRAFGSRAKWIARDYSDLDLVIVGDQPLGWRALGQLETAFKESDLPFRVDVLDWHDISDNFRTLIEVDCVVIKNGSMQYTKWSEKPIGEVAKIVGGSTPSTKVPENFGGNIPWITPKDLSDSQNRYIYRGKRNLSQKGLEDCSAKLLPQGTVLLSTRAPVGYVAIAGTNIATNQGFRNLLFDKNIVDPEFAYYWLTSNTEELERHASGSTFKELSGSALKNIRMPVPSLSEQRRIVHILGTLDDKIELNRRINKTLEAMAQTLFKSWFVDFDPVRAKMEGRWRPGESLPGLPAHLYDLFPDRLVPSELGEIPENWQIGVLDDAIELLSGGTPNTTVNQYWDGEIPWYTAKDAPSLSDVFAIETERTVTPLGVQNSPTKILPKGTTIITARGTVGNLALLSIPMAMNQTCYGIRGKNGYPDFFTYWSIRTTVTKIRTRTHGTIFDTITRQTFKLIEFVRPPKDIAHAFEATITPSMERILENLKDSHSLARLQKIKLLEWLTNTSETDEWATTLEGL